MADIIDISGIPAYKLSLTGSEVENNLKEVNDGRYLDKINGRGSGLTLAAEADGDEALLKRLTIKEFFPTYLIPENNDSTINKTLKLGWDHDILLNYISRDGLTTTNSLLYVNGNKSVAQVVPAPAQTDQRKYVLKSISGMPTWNLEAALAVQQSGSGNAYTGFTLNQQSNGDYTLILDKGQTFALKSELDITEANANSRIAKSTLATKGDIIYASAADTPAKLSIGTAGYFLKANSSGVPEWSALPELSISDTTSSGNVIAALAIDTSDKHKINVTRASVVDSSTYVTDKADFNSRLGNKVEQSTFNALDSIAVKATSFTAKGDLMYASAQNTITRLPIGTSGQVLKTGSNNSPIWANETNVTVTSNGTTSGNTAITGISVDSNSHSIKYTSQSDFVRSSQIGDKITLEWNASTSTLTIVKN